jgi:hypothetical protein
MLRGAATVAVLPMGALPMCRLEFCTRVGLRLVAVDLGDSFHGPAKVHAPGPAGNGWHAALRFMRGAADSVTLLELTEVPCKHAGTDTSGGDSTSTSSGDSCTCSCWCSDSTGAQWVAGWKTISGPCNGCGLCTSYVDCNNSARLSHCARALCERFAGPVVLAVTICCSRVKLSPHIGSTAALAA